MKNQQNGNTIFKNEVVKSLFNGGIYRNTNGIYNPSTNEEGIIKTSLMKGKIDKSKKEIYLQYEVLKETTDWVLKELKEMNHYYINILDEGDKRISEMILDELKDYTIITQRWFNGMIFQGVVEPKNKLNNRWFN
ncbi:MAG: hypothetical protein HWE24_21285 [Oceanospirillaceae bacterium]|nr:hypothetical protein [Oceanospirillaceae bacterium]